MGKRQWLTGLSGLILLGATLSLSLPVRAEPEEAGEAAEAVPPPKARPKPRPTPKAKAKPKASSGTNAAKLPAAPIPYTQLSAGPQTAKDEHGHEAAAPAPSTASPPALMASPVTAPAHAFSHAPEAPPPPPVAAPETAPMIPATTHDLKCETQVIGPKGLISRGHFTLEVTLSDVFPEDTARFRLIMADPRHQSLLKDTPCETLDCRVSLSANYFDLYNARTKRGAQLRATLDRHTGAFLARKTDGKLPLGGSTLIKEGPGEYEQGYCTPQKRETKLF